MHDVIFDPRLWASMEAGDEARVVSWLATEGDHVHTGQVIAQVRLLHQTLDVVAAHNGLLEDILVPAGNRFAHGAVLARVVPF